MHKRKYEIGFQRGSSEDTGSDNLIPGVTIATQKGHTMQRALGFLFVGLAIAGTIAQMMIGLHTYVGDALQATLGPYVTDTFHSPVGGAVVYGFFYFVGACGLVMLATANRARK
ncbi:MAG: hypothetical protein MPJ78_01905 [Hyphomicrobiaceae bacterium]|nr:hypothetical protein [Hyphomicrobiaceae bacterium]